MAKYITAQRKKLLEFFEQNPDRLFTPRQIADALQEKGISQSAVYRNLIALEEDGMLRRSVKEGSREFYYQCVYLDVCKNSIHITCTTCGKTEHAPIYVTKTIMEKMLNETGFIVDKTKTVLYGKCSHCM